MAHARSELSVWAGGFPRWHTGDGLLGLPLLSVWWLTRNPGGAVVSRAGAAGVGQRVLGVGLGDDRQ